MVSMVHTPLRRGCGWQKHSWPACVRRTVPNLVDPGQTIRAYARVRKFGDTGIHSTPAPWDVDVADP